jgi:DNA-binding PadR family transcriptional regulator
MVAYILSEKPSWGYEIIAKIYGKLHILLSPGAVYPLLHNMEKKGLIRKERREIYSLTEEGRKWLKQMLEATNYERMMFLQRYLQATSHENWEEYDLQDLTVEAFEGK